MHKTTTTESSYMIITYVLNVDIANINHEEGLDYRT